MGKYEQMPLLERDLRVSCDSFMSDLLDLYNCQNWVMGFNEFLEKTAEIFRDTVNRWQTNIEDEEE